MADDMATMKAFTVDERKTMESFSAEALINTETIRFRLDPMMTYVPREVRAQDPAFWMPQHASPTPTKAGPKPPVK